MNLVEAYSELLEKIALPPRHGERGAYILAKRALERLETLSSDFSAAYRKVNEARRWYIDELLDALGLGKVDFRGLNENLGRFVDHVRFASEDFVQSFPMGFEHSAHWSAITRAWDRHPFSAFYELAEQVKASEDLAKLTKADIAVGVADADIGWEAEYEEGLAPEYSEALLDMAVAADGILKLSKEVRDRIEAARAVGSSFGDSGNVVGAGDTETLYHASIKARQLYKKGFMRVVPGTSGLGGPQEAKRGKAATSFTYDLYVAKEIARTFKELVMIAKGEVTARDILNWAVRDRSLSKMVRDVNQLRATDGYSFIDTDKGWEFTKGFSFVQKGEVVDANEVFDKPEKTVWLYKTYLLHMRDQRYDPYVIEPHRLVPQLQRTNIRDIGVVQATVDMTNPDIRHLGSERELRVPPEAIVSVDKFIR